MKEHLYYIIISLMPHNYGIKEKSTILMKETNNYLLKIIKISQGNILKEVLNSNEIITPYTLVAEQVTSYYTNVPIDTNFTMLEHSLSKNLGIYTDISIDEMINLNQEAYLLVSNIINLKTTLLEHINNCTIFTTMYPHFLEHNIEEAREYLLNIEQLQQNNSEVINKLLEVEYFWNDKMGEHAGFLDGLLDLTEVKTKEEVKNFADKFSDINNDIKKIFDNISINSNVTMESLKDTASIIKFQEVGVEKLLNCNLKSIILPLIADHMLREANHYLRLLKESSN